MKSIMHDFYFGRIVPWERGASTDPGYREVKRKIEDEERYFTGKMSLDDCQRFEAFKGLFSQASSFEEVEIFSLGFKLGALFMLEILEDGNGQPDSEN